MTRLIIVRHGNTFEPGETPRRIGARTDLQLVASGRAQAAALAAHFAATRFDRILTSPLRRTRETAEAIVARQPDPRPIETAAWLAEIDHGPDEDRTDAEIVARIGAEALAAWDREARVPDRWSVDPDTRIAAWRALLAPSDTTILLVTSNGAARFALLAIGGPDLPSLKLRTGAWGEIDVTGNGTPVLESWDRRP